jgi:hypothetical protein
MGMSTHVVGIKPADAKFKEMLAIYRACEKAKVSIPKEVDDFFDGETPDESGVVVSLEASAKGPVQEWQDDSAEGYEVDLRKLPADIKILRFYNSW